MRFGGAFFGKVAIGETPPDSYKSRGLERTRTHPTSPRDRKIGHENRNPTRLQVTLRPSF